MIVFARIDFSEDAKHAGLQLNPTKLIIFGNPKGGTPLMQASPSVAIDFPLKILVSTDNSGNNMAIVQLSPVPQGEAQHSRRPLEEYLRNREHS